MIDELLLYFLVGLVEWMIGILSSRLIAKGKLWGTVFVIFFEQLLGFWVFFSFVKEVNRWDFAIAYSLGAAVGSGIGMFLTRDLRDVKDGETTSPGPSLPKVRPASKPKPQSPQKDEKV